MILFIEIWSFKVSNLYLVFFQTLQVQTIHFNKCDGKKFVVSKNIIKFLFSIELDDVGLC